jgi:very-short-patch-repair endonuclease
LRYYPDIKLSQRPIIIEVDGWGHYMLKNAEIDAHRDAELREAGYEVVRFTNEQVEADADECVRGLVARFGLEPEESPVALVRSRRGGTPIPTFPIYSDEDIV